MRRDLLPECNGSNAPLDIFAESCCKFCINAECSRSQFGKTKFDQRVSTWEERLFSKVPRMNPADPRFTLISGQKFLSLDVGRVPEVGSSWMDPRDLEAQQGPLGAAPPAPVVNVEAAVVTQAPTQASDQPVSPPAVTAPKLVSRRMVLGNTPSQSGTVLPGGASPSTPSADPWAAPTPAPATATETPANVVKPGATVKLRGSGV